MLPRQTTASKKTESNCCGNGWAAIKKAFKNSVGKGAGYGALAIGGVPALAGGCLGGCMDACLCGCKKEVKINVPGHDERTLPVGMVVLGTVLGGVPCLGGAIVGGTLGCVKETVSLPCTFYSGAASKAEKAAAPQQQTMEEPLVVEDSKPQSLSLP